MRSELASKALEDGSISSFSIQVASGGYEVSVTTTDGEDLKGQGDSPDGAFSDALNSETAPGESQGDPAPSHSPQVPSTPPAAASAKKS